MKDYVHSNGRRTQRTSGGQFRKTTLKDFGFQSSDINKAGVVCAGCDYGQNAAWYPILASAPCPKCGQTAKAAK
jgi:hypothetical protein